MRLHSQIVGGSPRHSFYALPIPAKWAAMPRTSRSTGTVLRTTWYSKLRTLDGLLCPTTSAGLHGIAHRAAHNLICLSIPLSTSIVVQGNPGEWAVCVRYGIECFACFPCFCKVWMATVSMARHLLLCIVCKAALFLTSVILT